MNKKKIRLLIILLLISGVIRITFYCYSEYIMSPDLFYCQDLALKYFSHKKDNIELKYIKKRDLADYGKTGKEAELIWICFTMPDFEYYEKSNSTLSLLWNETNEYLKTHPENKLNEKYIELFITYHSDVTGICNYNILDDTLLEDGGVLFDAMFDDWKDADIFCDAYGMNCYMIDITDLDDIDVEKWKNLKFLHLKTYQEQEVIDDVKAELMNMFPGVDVRINEFDENEAQP